MAVSDSSRFSIAAVGVPQVGSDFDKFEMNATPKYPLGFKIERANGDVYRYTHFGANTNRGVLVSQDLSETSLVDDDNHLIAPSSTYQMPDEPNGVYPGAIGSRYIIMTLANTSAHVYAGAKITITDDTGEGYTYDVVDNTATDNPASGKIRIQLAQQLQVAIDTTSDVSIQGCLYNDVETATTGTDAIVAGVSCATMVVATAPYGWIQTKGVVGILQDAKAVTVGCIVTLSKLTAGAVGPLGGASTDATSYVAEPIVGYCVDPGDSTGYTVCKINLE